MTNDIIILKEIPDLNDALFIAGFDGWGNALNISRGMVDYIIRKLNADPFSKINPDNFYKFDDNRPLVDIQNGVLIRYEPPGGTFYYIQKAIAGRDIIVLSASEPNLHWYRFSDIILSICRKAKVQTIVCLGSMYDNVLHTDNVFSGIASDTRLISKLKERNINAINYKGPSAIHSTLHSEAIQKGFQCIGLWCHCPHYLQGTTHFGLLAHLGSFLSSWGGFELDTKELEIAWKDLNKQIQGIIDKNPELQTMIHDMRKAKIEGAWDMSNRGDKVIKLEDFIKPR